MRVIDLHCDSVQNIPDGKKCVNRINFSERYPQLQFFAVCVDNIALEKMKDTAYGLIDMLKSEFDGVLINDGQSFHKAERSERSGLISLEGASFVDMPILEKLYEKGVRSFIPAWNNVSRICATNRETGSALDFGVTRYGREIIRRAEELGMIIDVSHISDKGFFDIAEMTKKPFIASHSNARSVCNNNRNLTDVQIKTVIERGGIIGLNIFPPFVSEKYEFEDFYRHIDKILSLGGENALAFGFDIDGVDGCYFNEIPRFDSIHDFFIEKIKEKFGTELTEKIAFENAENFLSRHFA